ncbi:MAG: DUF4019 domain-containing protein [Acidobacteria bacterium]|nr:DUF4019 domain-containing protein [Acidobacteriota bacterium]
MKNFLRLFTAVLMVAGVTTVSTAADNSKKEAAAIKAATNWLQLVDNGKYVKSWEEAATIFKKAVSKEKWEKAMVQVRKPLGDLISRKVKSATFTTSLPGVPDGQYVVIQFETVFANKKSAVETITPMLDKDGNWHVSGYFIR